MRTKIYWDNNRRKRFNKNLSCKECNFKQNKHINKITKIIENGEDLFTCERDWDTSIFVENFKDKVERNTLI